VRETRSLLFESYKMQREWYNSYKGAPHSLQNFPSEASTPQLPHLLAEGGAVPETPETGADFPGS
jgi:hypothetical protein